MYDGNRERPPTRNIREEFLAAQRRSARGFGDNSLAGETLPALPALRSPSVKRPRRPRRWLMAGIAGALALTVVATSTLLALADPSLLSFAFGPSASVRPTNTAMATATATLPPTATSTATPAPTLDPRVTGGISLGCSAAQVHPTSYAITSGPTTYREVALTFDDGPSSDYTANMLTTLEQTHTPATFFVVGSNVDTHQALVRREAADGFTIAIHTYYHPFMTKLTPTQRAWELSETAAAIHRALGSNYCVPYWRPPFRDYNAAVLEQTQYMKLATVTWSVDPADYSSPGVSVIVGRVLSAAQPGSIILLHDGYWYRSQTAAALPQIIQGLHAHGLIPVTLPQLLSGAPPPSAPTATPTSALPTAVPPP
jgi:peptidoglycan-N-acetylglucosamine deacetylase